MVPVPAWFRDEKGARIPVRPEGTLVGRAESCAIVVSDEQIPLRHAVLLRGVTGTEMVVIDGPSPSINGRASAPRELLSDGDVLSIAGQKLVHEWTPETLSSDW